MKITVERLKILCPYYYSSFVFTIPAPVLVRESSHVDVRWFARVGHVRRRDYPGPVLPLWAGVGPEVAQGIGSPIAGSHSERPYRILR